MSGRRSPERAAIRIARKLVSEIRRRRLRPGAKLVSEQRMVEELGVARATVREALRFLELQGALRIKAGPGGGPIVNVPGAEHLASVLSLHLQFANASFNSVVDARRAIYPTLAYQAAENASSQDLATLREALSAMRNAQGDPELFTDMSRRFMSVMSAASGNRVLALLVDALHRMSEGGGTPWDEKQQRSAMRSYDKVFHAIESGDAEEARTRHGEVTRGRVALLGANGPR